MNYKNAISLLIPLLLAACATPQSARSKGTVGSYVSNKSAETVSDCVAAAWEDQGHASELHVRPTSNGYTLNISRQTHFGESNTLVLLDITNNGSGSISKLYEGFVIGAEKLEGSVKDCQ